MPVDAPPIDVAQRARRHIARRVMPYLFILYVINFLDRMNVGAAALQMPKDLGFSDGVVGLGAGIFFLGYFLLEIPGALIAERWSARRNTSNSELRASALQPCVLAAGDCNTRDVADCIEQAHRA